MRAAVLWRSGEPFDVTEVELAPIGAHDVLVRIAGVGMCHTDLVRRDPSLPPTIMGHEGSGVVVEVGSAVSAVSPGDHVVATFDSCGRCPACRSGHPAYCAEFEALNIGGGRAVDAPATTADGRPVANGWFGQSSFAEYAVCSERNLVVVDEELPLEQLGPFGCGLLTGTGAVLNDMRLAPGQSIAVFGAGAVGLAAVMAARIAGAAEIVVADVVEARLDLAAELGATRVVRGSSDDLAAEVRAGGPGVDFSLDTTGVPGCVTAAIDALARPGRAVLVGSGGRAVTIDPRTLAGRELTFVLEGDAVPQILVPQLLEFWRRGLFPFERLIRTYPLDAINRAVEDSLDGTVVKPILIP